MVLSNSITTIRPGLVWLCSCGHTNGDQPRCRRCLRRYGYRYECIHDGPCREHHHHDDTIIDQW
jgi:hypothetical protein